MDTSEEVLDTKYSNPYEQSRLAILRTLIHQGQGNAALDLGCGSGVTSELLVNLGWAVTAVDLHPDNVARAEGKVARAIHGDAVGVCRSLNERSYGFICALELIEHLAEGDRLALLRETWRLAGPRARLLLSTPNRMSPNGLYGYYYAERIKGIPYKAWDSTHQRIYSSFEILAALKKVGWKPVKTVGYHYKGKISLPLEASSRFPLNRFGFNTIILSERQGD